MAALTTNTIASTYTMLLKTTAVVDATLRYIEDGAGTDTTLKVATDAISIDATDKLYLDAGGNTYIYESAADIMDFYAGGAHMLSLDETNDEAVFNEGAADLDFRIESNAGSLATHALFVRGSDGYIGIGDSTPDARLDVYDNTDDGWVAIFDQDHATGYGVKVTGDMTGTDPLLKVESGSTSILRVQGDGKVGIGTGSPTTVLEVAGGFLQQNVTLQSSTTAENLTATTGNLIWYATTTQAGDITLPQATSANAGMVIKIIAGADWSSTAFKLGYASGGSTVMVGTLRVSALDAVLTTSFAITANAKNLVIDANAVATAGGAKGSTYTFTYLAANLVHVDANAYITTGTVATTAAASVTGGI